MKLIKDISVYLPKTKGGFIIKEIINIINIIILINFLFNLNS